VNNGRLFGRIKKEVKEGKESCEEWRVAPGSTRPRLKSVRWDMEAVIEGHRMLLHWLFLSLPKKLLT
jgi:hypothetical protein